MSPIDLFHLVSFESYDGSGNILAVTESDGSLEVVLILSNPVGKNVTVNVVTTAMTATGLLNVFCILKIITLFSWWRFLTISKLTSNFYCRISKAIPIVNDDTYELEETFQPEISVPETAVVAGVIDGCDPYNPSTTVRITDDHKLS